jgi:hypothetical protein
MPRRADDQDLDWVGLWGDCLARQRGLMWNKVLKKGGDNVWRMEREYKPIPLARLFPLSKASPQ